jgi:hypothetical protein
MTTAKRSNQERAPQCAAFVEALRTAFGADQVKVLYVREGEVQMGKPINSGNAAKETQ